jgi:hypothetical protein
VRLPNFVLLPRAGDMAEALSVDDNGTRVCLCAQNAQVGDTPPKIAATHICTPVHAPHILTCAMKEKKG